MRRLAMLTLLTALLLPGAAARAATDGLLLGLPVGSPTATVNGATVTLDSPAVILGGRTLVPIRFISESLGATVGWNGETRQVTVSRAGHTLLLTIGQRQATFDGAPIRIDVAPAIINDRTLVPLRLIGERLGAYVGWEAARRTAWVALGSPPGLVLMLDNVFDPTRLTVQPGATVVLINADREEHTVTDFDAEAYDLNVAGGEAVTLTFTEAGIHRYTCLLHEQMDGSITVVP